MLASCHVEPDTAVIGVRPLGPASVSGVVSTPTKHNEGMRYS